MLINFCNSKKLKQKVYILPLLSSYMINKDVPKKRIVIFDLDGTLVDSDKWVSKELIETFKGLGVSITEREATTEGKKDKYALAAKYGFSKKELDISYRENFKNLYTLDDALSSGEITLYPETIKTLNSLKENGVNLGLLPRASRQSDLIRKVQNLGLEEYFGNRISVVSNGQKTKYEGAVDLLRKMQGQEGDVYCVGDRAEDVLVADDLRKNYQVNAKGIYVHRSNSPDSKLEKYSQVKSLEEIPKLILEN